MNRNQIGAGLVFLALVLAVVGFIAWTDETKEAESRARVAAFGGRSAEGPDRMLPITLWSMAGLSVICGTIVLSTAHLAPPPPRDDTT